MGQTSKAMRLTLLSILIALSSCTAYNDTQPCGRTYCVERERDLEFALMGLYEIRLHPENANCIAEKCINRLEYK